MFGDLEKLKELAEKVPAQLDRLERKLDAIIGAQIVFADSNAAKGTAYSHEFDEASGDLQRALAPAEQGAA